MLIEHISPQIIGGRAKLKDMLIKEAQEKSFSTKEIGELISTIPEKLYTGIGNSDSKTTSTRVAKGV